MLSSLLGPSRGSWGNSRGERPFFSSRRRPAKKSHKFNTETDSVSDIEDNGPEEDNSEDNGKDQDVDQTANDGDDEGGDDQDEDEGEDGTGDMTSLLPIFSAAHLDALPVYNLTHTIRLLVVSRCETTLTWDQLRSPQVSQFLLKPIQQQIRSAHFSSATEYALMANCLQFQKEIGLNPGNSGTSRTRAMVCELLAIKLLKEYSARELIDALSYDFDPFQGQLPQVQDAAADKSRASVEVSRRKAQRVARISCVEIAIRAQAKRFLAYPLVVQQLEAVWAGSIVFHSAADSLHRSTQKGRVGRLRSYGTSDASTDRIGISRIEDPMSRLQQAEQSNPKNHVEVTYHRTVSLYSPRNASIFKLSRLRVPRYRNFLSTISFAVLLGLFLAVLVEHSLEITSLEVFFWFWAAGYMLDEIVGFNEQGFSLYLASFWNIFDLGILLILVIHLLLRVYSVIMPDTKRHSVAHLAYDILAADAVLLFPRLFSVLDHYRYFSQLLIAFRMMASDMVAVFVLILISCSGFFVALTLGFGNDTDTPGSVAFAVLQILMGFTPAAWDRWPGYNALGKTILTLFLFICHFLVVTILITVLTNSFMAIVRNANEEHQYVFAVNTLSMVKSDALFSYIAPANVIAWILTPLRYVLPFRQFVKLNRTVIKVTHFPILFTIFLYEKMILSSSVYDGIDLVEPQRHLIPKPRLLRALSNATVRQELALEEVFRRPYEETVGSPGKSQVRQNASHVVNNWMRSIDEAVLTSPQDRDRDLGDETEKQQRSVRRHRRLVKPREFRRFSRSAASDPEEFAANNDFLSPKSRPLETNETTPLHVGGAIESTSPSPAQDFSVRKRVRDPGKLDYFSIKGNERSEPLKIQQSAEAPSHPTLVGKSNVTLQFPMQGSISEAAPRSRPAANVRNASEITVLNNRAIDSINVPSVAENKKQTTGILPTVGLSSYSSSGALTSSASKPASNITSRRTPKKPVAPAPRVRPIMPPKQDQASQSTPNLAGLTMLKSRQREGRQVLRSLEMGIGSDLGDNNAVGGGYVAPIAASFGTQMALATGGLRRYSGRNEGQEMFSRLMLARMNQLEEGFREVVHEMRDHLRRDSSRSRSRHRRSRQTARHLTRARKSAADVNLEAREGQHQQRHSVKQADSPRPTAGPSRQEAEEWVDEDDNGEMKGSSV